MSAVELEIISGQEIDRTVAGLEPGSAVAIKASFAGFIAEAARWASKAKSIVVADESQVAEMQEARELRLKLREIRCSVENARKELKADSLARGKAIDGMANLIKGIIEPLEAHLQEQEQYAERKEASRRLKLRERRATLLAPYLANSTHIALAEMSEQDFQKLLEDSKLLHETKLRQAREAEELRRKNERDAGEERERMRAENERLRVEREKLLAEQRRKDEESRKEREAIEAKARAAEDEARRLREEEAAKVAAVEAAKKRASLAPDCEKLTALAAMIRAIEVPDMATEEGRDVRRKILGQIDKFGAWVDAEAAKLAGKGAVS